MESRTIAVDISPRPGKATSERSWSTELGRPCGPATESRSPTSSEPGRIAIQQRRGHNKACCALANNLARIVWAVWRSGEPYRAETA